MASFTYDLTTAVGQVRLMIGDTNVPDGTQFSDDEITFMLTQSGNNVPVAAVAALENWSRQMSTKPKIYIGDYQEDPTVTAKNMLAQAQKLREQIHDEDADPAVGVGGGAVFYQEMLPFCR